MAEQQQIETGSIEQVQLHARNTNKGTKRGRDVIEHSLRQYGAERSILLDRNLNAIAGNHVTEVAADIGLSNVVFVHTRGDQVVAVVRDDLDIGSPQAQALAIADNRASEVGLNWDASVLAELAATDSNLLDGLFRDDEIDVLLAIAESNANGIDDPLSEWKGMPMFEQKDTFGAIATIQVHFKTAAAVQTFSNLLKQVVTQKTRSIWFPAEKSLDLKNYIAHDES